MPKVFNNALWCIVMHFDYTTEQWHCNKKYLKLTRNVYYDDLLKHRILPEK